MSYITPDEIKSRVITFLTEHNSEYTEREIRYIERYATIILERPINHYIGDVLRQIYDEVGLLPEENNMYSGFVSLLEKNFNLDTNIVEVAGGVIPVLAKKIALKQSHGTITVYDPRLTFSSPQIPNLILKKQEFTKSTPLTNTNIIIGFMPCDATIQIIEAALANDIDFMVALCEGGPRTGYEWLETEEEWVDYIKYIAKLGLEKQKKGTLGVASLAQYGNPYPVIYSKKK